MDERIEVFIKHEQAVSCTCHTSDKRYIASSTPRTQLTSESIQYYTAVGDFGQIYQSMIDSRHQVSVILRLFGHFCGETLTQVGLARTQLLDTPVI